MIGRSLRIAVSIGERVALKLLFFLVLISGCVSQPEIPRDAIDVEGEVLQKVHHDLSGQELPHTVKILARTELVTSDTRKHFRLAITAEREGNFLVQVLPTTSLTVLDTIRITPTSISFAEGSMDLEASRLRTILGGVITPRELFFLLSGVVPNSGGFREFFDGTSEFRSLDDVIYSQSSRVSTQSVYRVSDGTFYLRHLVLRDFFQLREVLQVEYEGEVKVAWSAFPEVVVPSSVRFTFPKRDISLDMTYQKVQFVE